MSSTIKKLTPADRKKFQKEMSALKKAGLLPAKVDIRKIQPTRHYRGLSRKFEGVITGRDVTVKIPKGASLDASAKITRKGKVAVVPRPQLNGKVRYDKKSGELQVTARVRGAKVTSVYRDYDRDGLRSLEARNVRFSIYVPRGGRYEVFRVLTVDELDAVFKEDGSFKNFGDWVDFVNVEYITEEDDADFEETPFDYQPRVGRGGKMRKRKVSKTGRN